ncbi:SMP-30/gluconolactonase/LRE family protein [Bradyrhizobium sp. AS23.2]|uniref:ABC transporter permease n=1 Tax=Bradyrhizobium sp. AS23.2 TaxID=1680155 RepID=UPI00093CD351|nr:SMP-30/gluconolactonase/LRE family protein [Bradyrhizobium sp. AS23.2]OKO84569.1 ABC transporter permease [Bradyrhizobium sp. AS23.2]
MNSSDTIAKWRSRFIPDHVVGEILTKEWIDTAIPVVMFIASIIAFSLLLPHFLSLGGIVELLRQMGELTFVTMGMAIVIMAGGIDLSVGSVFALANFLTLACVNYLAWPPYLALPIVIAICGLCGLVNGVLVGYLRLRAFLTTLATLIIVRALVDYLLFHYGSKVVESSPDSEFWDFLSFGTVFGFPFNYLAAIVAAVVLHVFLTRMRLGWHIRAVGGSRRSAHNAGINVRRTVCLSYIVSALLTGIAGVLYAARLNNAGTEAGVGLEVVALTAAVLGGNSLGGGRGSIPKAALGAFIVALFTNSLLRFTLPSGANPLAIGLILLLAVATDVRWLKNRHKLLSRVYVSPAYFEPPPLLSTAPDSGTPYAVNNKLQDAEPIGLDQVDGAEDIAFDADDNLYTGSRHGDILRFEAPDYASVEVFAHIGGQPLGLHFDGDGSLFACVSGMGLYKITRDREIIRLSDETNRTLLSIVDDSRMRFADDMDFAPDGRVFFSEATIRYDIFDWATDSLEARGNGRIICWDPRTNASRTVLPKRMFPNGICMIGDNESLLFAETWAARINRYWFDGPHKGKVECVIPDMPGYPDNIRRSSDGNFWVAMLGMRTPALDLAMKMPGFRRRMAQRVAFEEWIYPNINTGGVVKFDANGNVLESLWDASGDKYPMITSMREHKGYLYLAGVYNNRIGRYRIPGADPSFNDRHLYWDKRK